MRQINLIRGRTLLLTFLIATSLLAGLTSTPSAARAEVTVYSEVNRAVFDQADGTMWVQWADRASNGSFTSNHLGHFSVQGQALSRYELPSNSQPLGFVVQGAVSRFFYYQYELPDFAFKSFYYLDLKTGQSKALTFKAGVDPIHPPSTLYGLIYNPVANHFYVGCDSCVGSITGAKTRSVVLDLGSDQVTGLLDHEVRGFNPLNNKLYVTTRYEEAGTAGNTLEWLDLVTLDATTEQATPDAPLVKKFGPYGFISSLLVNPKTGQVFLNRRTCYAKCQPVQAAVFDKDNNKVEDFFVTYYEVFNGLNSNLNQLYVTTVERVRPDLIAVNASNLKNGQLASFTWTPLAVDSERNRVLAVDRRSTSVAGLNSGLGLVVMDALNYDIVKYFSLTPPDPQLTQNAKPLPGLPAGMQGRYFPLTGHTLSGKFLQYWETHGGLAIFGYSITEPFMEYNPESGRTHLVQYFERNRFELHEENAGTPYEVELGLLGRSFGSWTGPAVSGRYGSGETSPVPGGLLFKETGHTLTGKFLEYWQSHGGLAQFGLPLTEPFTELSPIDGKTYTVQYLERNRFEYHPEFAGTQYEVELGLLGSQQLLMRGWPL